ncbi:MAG: arginine deiminase [Bacteroidetes bacterium]|uniref:arginine deiminase n=1 Tax=Candidatus Cryptobacteroides faecipullorum TaxID=2840764 RepID=A0A9D9I748_9BACT|nr:arginine deiminase [Candidatus Cryptobacteroides faecipullorum]
MTENRIKINVSSEIGRLDAVLLHPPGAEVENMTPRNVQRALYSDILNLSIAREEYRQLQGVLSKVADVYIMDDLLVRVLDNPESRTGLLQRICVSEDATDYYGLLLDMPSRTLAKVLIEGLPARIDTLTAFLKNEYYALYPLYNFYFTRDAAVTIGGSALVCRMANKVRMRESYIMDAICRSSGVFDCRVVDANDFQPQNSPIMMEGGDIIVAREDILLLGNGCRTSSQGIDFMIERFRREHDKGRYHVIVQQLPSEPESFIHLDMVFTFLDRDKCMIFEPLILGDNQYQTVHITISDGKVSKITSAPDILTVLRRLGMDLEPVVCGGPDEWDQEREQWHSGANCFAFAPGKVITYARNIHTLEELDRAGFSVVSADDVISGKVHVDGDGRYAVTVAGSELPRGGGGARCMTMPLSRREVKW